jgi:mevalonate kinase
MRASACAKAILLGEHAVVHGVPAIAVPIAARKTDVDIVETDASGEVTVEDTRGVETALAAKMVRLALDMTTSPPKGARVKIASTIPLGSGLGSSAALAVAIVRACRGGTSLEASEVARRANELERLAHGTPSGIDATAIAYERPIWFSRGGRDSAPKVTEAFRVASPLRLALGVLPRTGTTASLVAGVAKLKQVDELRFRMTLDGIEAAAESARFAIEGKDTLETLASDIADNRALLRDFGVSTPAVESACDAAIAAGALAAKLSGAGGGGAVIALLGPQSDPDRVLAALRASGATDAFITEIPPS